MPELLTRNLLFHQYLLHRVHPSQAWRHGTARHGAIATSGGRPPRPATATTPPRGTAPYHRRASPGCRHIDSLTNRPTGRLQLCEPRALQRPAPPRPALPRALSTGDCLQRRQVSALPAPTPSHYPIPFVRPEQDGCGGWILAGRGWAGLRHPLCTPPRRPSAADGLECRGGGPGWQGGTVAAPWRQRTPPAQPQSRGPASHGQAVGLG